MRRFVSVLLALILVVSSFIPCGDVHAAPVPEDTQTLISTDGSTSPHEHDLRDGCSPFCACACCAAVVLPAVIRVACRSVFVVPGPARTAPRIRYLEGTAVPIWQPPWLG